MDKGNEFFHNIVHEKCRTSKGSEIFKKKERPRPTEIQYPKGQLNIRLEYPRCFDFWKTITSTKGVQIIPEETQYRKIYIISFNYLACSKKKTDTNKNSINSYDETDGEETELLTMEEREGDKNDEEEKYFIHSDDEKFSKMENGNNKNKKKKLKEIDGKDEKICDVRRWSIYELMT